MSLVTSNLSDRAASEISDRLVQKVIRALNADDFNSFADCFTVPGLIRASTGFNIIHSRNCLKRLFCAKCLLFQKHQAQTLVASLDTHAWMEGNAISFVFASRFLSTTGKPVGTAFPTLCVARFDTKKWKIQQSVFPDMAILSLAGD
ncbi:MAG: hypothetical protein AAF066_17820 [Pseudomonadota bacterium]